MADRRPPASAAVLLLHGGGETGLTPPPAGPLNLAALRMRPFARSLARATRDGPVDVRVHEVRYGHRGWNGSRADPLHDAVRALDDVQGEFGGIPVVLVGHSMGARAALRAAGHPLVRGVVGLAPWCPPDEPVSQLAGRDVVLLHSTRDRVTSPEASRSFATRARRAGARSCLVTIRASDHAMLRRARVWHTATTGLVTALLGLSALPAAVDAALRLPPSAPAADGTVDYDRLRRAAGEAPAGTRP
ncbi:alpha/beta fold hydrolase [Streptomyces sp. NPDC058231]|uniref:alpha/beta fold hydrolase n=1 Tax=Streptomyces sp. NPDC058231 TaxID=3346392 RepID=UPI0036EC90BC